MRFSIVAILVLFAALSGHKAWAVDNLYDFDNATYTPNTVKLYDSIETKFKRNRYSKFFYNLFFVDINKPTKNSMDKTLKFDEFRGYEIEDIYIHRINVFDTTRYNNWFARFGNKIHRITHERRIRQDIFFSRGDDLDPQALVYNEQFLQARSYLYRANIRLEHYPMDDEKIDLHYYTQDTWSLGFSADLSLKSNSSVDVFDKNILGTGYQLNVKTNFNIGSGEYGGNQFEFTMPNLFGSFFSVNLYAGHNFTYYNTGVGVNKSLIQKSDYMLKLGIYERKEGFYNLSRDTTTTIKHENIELQVGKSFFLEGINSSIYLIGSFTHRYYTKRDRVSEILNPEFHNKTLYLLGLGIYRENFNVSNLIYGFGHKEYVSRGFKAELLGGFRHSEFFDDFYMGLNFSQGEFTNIGYIMAKFEIGSYVEPQNNLFRQSALSAEIRYFSNILKAGRSRIRQFVSAGYIRGWNRLQGSNEFISLDRDDLRGLDIYAYGQQKLLINTETVVFTPYSPLGFRLAIFGFADFGIIGNQVNMQRNACFTTFGLGVRIKNEHLVFSRLELRLGFSINNQGWINNDIFRFSNDYSLDQYRYLPSGISTIDYQ
ncbi:MAG: hypothetical protein R3Y38_04225 [Rikenellaceae bacterium]